MKRIPIFFYLFLFSLGSLLIAGCLGVQPSLQTPTTDDLPTETSAPQIRETPPPLATPYADSPAAGVCAEAPGDSVVSVEIFPDIPTPRCLKVNAGQKLLVINRTESPLQVSLGVAGMGLQPDSEATLDKTFGEYLAPGVHIMSAEPYFGPEIWLTEE